MQKTVSEFLTRQYEKYVFTISEVYGKFVYRFLRFPIANPFDKGTRTRKACIRMKLFVSLTSPKSLLLPRAYFPAVWYIRPIPSDIGLFVFNAKGFFLQQSKTKMTHDLK